MNSFCNDDTCPEDIISAISRLSRPESLAWDHPPSATYPSTSFTDPAFQHQSEDLWPQEINHGPLDHSYHVPKVYPHWETALNFSAGPSSPPSFRPLTRRMFSNTFSAAPAIAESSESSLEWEPDLEALRGYIPSPTPTTSSLPLAGPILPPSASRPYHRDSTSTNAFGAEEASTSRLVLGPLPQEFVRDASDSLALPPFTYPTTSNLPDATPFGGPTPAASSSTTAIKKDKKKKSPKKKSKTIYKLVEVASLSEDQLGSLNASQSRLPPGLALVEEKTRNVVNELFRAEEDEMLFSTYACLPDGTVTRRLGWYWCRWPDCAQHFYAKGEMIKHKTVHTKDFARRYYCKDLTPPCPCPENMPTPDERTIKRHVDNETKKWAKENENQLLAQKAYN